MIKQLFYSDNEPIILLDGGYMQCYRIHATICNLKFKFEDYDESIYHDITIEYFKTHLRKQLEYYKKKLKVSFKNFVLCLDSPCKTTWRYKSFPEYKSHRINNIKHSHDYNVAMLNVFNEFGISIIEQETLEADDLIAISVKQLRNKNNSQNKIIIITSDHDFKQLCKYSSLEILNAQLKPISLEDENKMEQTSNAEMMLWVKIFMGDKSDNIPPIFPKCGKVTAKKMHLDPEFKRKMINKHNAENKVNRNYNLISMDAIPEELQHKFNTLFQFIKMDLSDME